jgi:glycine cleavage system H protein
VNEALSGSPETVNKDPYASGWMFRLRPANAKAVDALLDAAAYDALVASEKH